jgi:hypothetical protein
MNYKEQIKKDNIKNYYKNKKKSKKHTYFTYHDIIYSNSFTYIYKNKF